MNIHKITFRHNHQITRLKVRNPAHGLNRQVIDHGWLHGRRRKINRNDALIKRCDSARPRLFRQRKNRQGRLHARHPARGFARLG